MLKSISVVKKFLLEHSSRIISLNSVTILALKKDMYLLKVEAKSTNEIVALP